MDNIEYKWTNSDNKDFQNFYIKTEEYYNEIVGGIENRREFVPLNLSKSIEDVLIAYHCGSAVACAGLKRYSSEDAEIKRVWVEKEYRGNHIAQELMKLIEEKAHKKGYKRAILQTRPIMLDAVGLYEKLGYKKIDNYPPYDNKPDAVCYAKEL